MLTLSFEKCAILEESRTSMLCLPPMGFAGLTQRRVPRRDTSLKTTVLVGKPQKVEKRLFFVGGQSILFRRKSDLFTTYGLRGSHTAPHSAAQHLPENCTFAGNVCVCVFFTPMGFAGLT